MNNAVIGNNCKLIRCLVAEGVKIPDGLSFGKKDSKEILLVSKELVYKAGTSHE